MVKVGGGGFNDCQRIEKLACKSEIDLSNFPKRIGYIRILVRDKRQSSKRLQI